MPSKAFVIYAQNVWQFCYDQHRENPFVYPLALYTAAHAVTQAGKLCEERLRALVIKSSTLTHTHTQKGLNMRVLQHKVLENTLGRIWYME